MLLDDAFGPTSLEPPSSPVRLVLLSRCLQGEVREGTAMHGVLLVLSRS